MAGALLPHSTEARRAEFPLDYLWPINVDYTHEFSSPTPSQIERRTQPQKAPEKQKKIVEANEPISI